VVYAEGPNQTAATLRMDLKIAVSRSAASNGDDEKGLYRIDVAGAADHVRDL
jgi:hypothetical protein